MQMGVKMYSPQIGRFLSVDPLHELMPGQNSYHYAFNSPLIWRDPSGLVPQKEKNREKLQRTLLITDLQGYWNLLTAENECEMAVDELTVVFDGKDFDALNCMRKTDRRYKYYPSLGFGGGFNGVATYMRVPEFMQILPAFFGEEFIVNIPTSKGNLILYIMPPKKRTIE